MVGREGEERWYKKSGLSQCYEVSEQVQSTFSIFRSKIHLLLLRPIIRRILISQQDPSKLKVVLSKKKSPPPLSSTTPSPTFQQVPPSAPKISPDTLSLAGKVVVITGSGRENGIGPAMAVALARYGAAVTINHVSDSSAPELKPSPRKSERKAERLLLIRRMLMKLVLGA